MSTKTNAASIEATNMSPEKQLQYLKHSKSFFIGQSLFNNKRLKRRRLRWAAARKAIRRRKKTERRKKRLSALKADVTIDLLSEDEGAEEESQQPQSQFSLYPAHIQLSQVPDITLEPAQQQSQEQLLPVMPVAAAPKAKQNKRKGGPRKRAQFLASSESIVLTDDEEQLKPLPAQIDPPPAPPILSAQVDEEVSVSLVPRSKTSGTCTANTHSNLFPMLPDETTVHTVIANRIYELSLTKLREGLASCGIPEFADAQQQKSAAASRRKKGNYAAPPAATPAPISLKLSSDLSISLISDDEQEQEELEHEQQQESFIMHQAIQQHSPQQAPLPVITSVRGARPKPRKRKLG